MSEVIEALRSLVPAIDLWRIPAAIAVLSFGFLANRLVQRRLTIQRLRPQQVLVVKNLTTYATFLCTLLVFLHVLGIDPSVLLGAAGILTVAIGFASQTSASNLISGLFLMTEQPFVIGDAVRVGEITGEVLSIDLLSVKIRTFDNLLVRIPNESLLKSNVTNFTRFPIRRLDVLIPIPFGVDLVRVRDRLLALGAEIDVCLFEPRPQVLFQSFAESSVSVQLSLWAARESILELRNETYAKLQPALAEVGVTLAVPARALRLGEGLEPPLRRGVP